MKTYNEKGLVKFKGDWYSITNESSANKVSIASSRQMTSLRNNLPFEHNVWQYGGWTREQLAYAPKEQGILVINSMLLNPVMAQKAVEANRNSDYLELSKSKYENFLRTAEKEEKSKKDKRSVLILPSRDNFEISPKENYNFAENLFGKENAEKYFKKLDEKNIESITFYTIDKDYVDKQSNPITTELWFRSLDGRSELYGSDWYLSIGDCRAFGVRSSASEASTQKISLPYNKGNIKSYLKVLQNVREGNLPASKLEKVIKGLEKLI